MAARLEDKKSELIEHVAEQLRARIGDEAEVGRAETFARRFFKGVAPEDVVDRDPLDLYGAALAELRFGEERASGKAKLRVYNPRIEQHGWQSTHTVLEIVNDDMPFLVDSVGMALNRQGVMIHLIIHPVVHVRRDEAGRLSSLSATPGDDTWPESFMHVEIDRQTDPERLERIAREVQDALCDVRAAVDDWKPMLAKVESALADLEHARASVPGGDVDEAAALLHWLADNHFTFLGYVDFDLAEPEGQGARLMPVEGSALGIVSRQPAGTADRAPVDLGALTESALQAARAAAPLVLTKSDLRSTVHRPAYLDHVNVGRYDEQGRLAGVRRFLGLLTSAAYNRNPREIPLLRRKVANVIERSGLAPHSHDGKALENVLQTYPRDELFQTGEDDLFETALGIVALQDRQRIRLFTRDDVYGRYVSCIVFIPRERYNTDIRQRIQALLQEAYDAQEVEFHAQISESVLARILFIVRMRPGQVPATVDRAEMEARIVESTRSWTDQLREALIDAQGEEDGIRLFRSFGEHMPAGYQEGVPARAAVADVLRIDEIAKAPDRLAMSLYQPLEANRAELRFKVYRAGEPITLSDALPLLENMGLRVLGEQDHVVQARDGRAFWLHDFGTHPTVKLAADIDTLRPNFHEAFALLVQGELENDGFNRLILGGGLSARQVMILRAYCKYQLQVGSPLSQAYIEQTLANHPDVAAKLALLFETRFDPGENGRRETDAAALTDAILQGLESVANLDEDRILRRYLRTIEATTRTNAFQTGADGGPKPYLSIKLDPAKVPNMPLPRPAYEIFVYSPRVEGVHLRGGRVARGGLRWSDRREDFRTEVLGLMKAQMVKNAVIVPVGAKGGFFVKRPPVDRDAYRAEGVACYRTFIRGLLDLTDNREGDGIVHPEATVRYDEDDPYLVVAADKGTATFSDIANAVAAEYGFWLGDAFASGGSAGYDHKGMAITARGAWESVKRHFYEMGRDCQTEPFTVVGVGDMSGDVFGNGMLLSTQTRLLAAFDHRHIFLDPDPDPAVSFAERKRLFDLPRSSWDDYDRALISKGGGVWPRSQKAIPLGDEAARALGMTPGTLTPQELMKGILHAPVDLFWNGGIGTFIKAAAERHGDVQDRTNDAIRADAEDLRCIVIGEGGNLGVTQLGRIRFAEKGGRINTDAIDNSAGVDCSDHEVNIKILIDRVTADGDLTTKQRGELLVVMTDDVAELVLRDNIFQVRALSLRQTEGAGQLDAQAAFMRRLEAIGVLNREVEFLPRDDEIAEMRQAGRGLPRPALAVLMAYAKTSLYSELLESDLPDEPYFVQDLAKYFPRELRRRYPGPLENHRLRREIIATLLANSLVNRGLDLFASELRHETGAPGPDVARAFVTARDALGLVPLWGETERIEAIVPAERQLDILADMRGTLEWGARWFLATVTSPWPIAPTVERFKDGVETVLSRLPDILSPQAYEPVRETVAELEAQGVAGEVALRFAALPFAVPALDVVEVAGDANVPLDAAAGVYFAVGEALDLGRLRRRIGDVGTRDRWERLALEGVLDDLMSAQRRLATTALGEGMASRQAIEAWVAAHPEVSTRITGLIDEIEASPNPGLPMFTVAVRAVGTLATTARRAAA
ncbi:NAD-glutamate dehydrogenase [Marinivivus vitaminiproducens]|uniref:NAD-glutamate dehydrogenase n=1 Tax=Marinivivus vitaminiproducens TaxID=3035935 RepID=UPI0027A5B02D|nr:NAD-glutamate dehydrogenase [Geminicoccaceae bacterium SCSIO 64248]